MTAVVFIGVLAGIFWGLHRLVRLLTQDAVAEARMRDLEKELEIADRQAAEVVKERTVEDVARDLDAGRF